jgi:hypothetical protein
MHIDGSCHCGAITYEADIDPGEVSICHCTDCQTLTGTAFRVSVACRADRFRVLRGEPSIYTKRADSGSLRAQGFCGKCGTPLYSTAADEKSTSYALRTGAIRQRASLIPARQVWCRSALSWLPSLSNITRHDKEDSIAF